MTCILVVCTANICRSPIAQILLTEALAGRGVEIQSAGVQASFGDRADPVMQALASESQASLLELHRAQPVMPQMLRKFDLILCMERHHVKSVVQMIPTRIGQVKLFGHWDEGDISDPYRGTPEQYTSGLQAIEKSAKQWADKLIKLGMVS